MDQGIQKSPQQRYDCGMFEFLCENSYLVKLQDPTVEIEQRRNRPMRYNRDKMETTIKAMKRISELREKRERQFFQNRFVNHLAKIFRTHLSFRMQLKDKQEYDQKLKDLADHLSLIEAPKELIEKQKIELMEAPVENKKKKTTKK